MQAIEFNHNYKKLHNQETAILIKTLTIIGRNICKEFIEYDTDNNYKIEPNEKYLLMYFIGEYRIPFTTLRKCNKTNVLKYVGRTNELFKIVVKEQK